jgi:hypothetical protein
LYNIHNETLKIVQLILKTKGERMSRLGKRILWSVVGIVVLGVLLFCFSVWVAFFNGEDLFIKWHLTRIIYNPVAIQSISKDTSTVEFLENLPKDPSISDIQEELDHNNEVEHYKVKINEKSVDLYVHINMFRTFSITKISVDGLPNLPEFFMD